MHKYVLRIPLVIMVIIISLTHQIHLMQVSTQVHVNYIPHTTSNSHINTSYTICVFRTDCALWKTSHLTHLTDELKSQIFTEYSWGFSCKSLFLFCLKTKHKNYKNSYNTAMSRKFPQQVSLVEKFPKIVYSSKRDQYIGKAEFFQYWPTVKIS